MYRFSLVPRIVPHKRCFLFTCSLIHLPLMKPLNKKKFQLNNDIFNLRVMSSSSADSDVETVINTLKNEIAQMWQAQQGSPLMNGIPYLDRYFAVSPPFVPTEKQHASCDRVEMQLPFCPSVSDHVSHFPCPPLLNTFMGQDGKMHYSYDSEADITFLVKTFLGNVVRALNLDLTFRSEITIKEIRPDICVILRNKYLVGVIEVKKPGKNVLLQPTVLGELLDQMLLVEGFYGTGPVIGILTSAEEWLVSWFPADSDALARVDQSETSASFIPSLQRLRSTGNSEECTPLGTTPSQLSGTIHSINAVTDDFPELEDGGAGDDEVKRLLCTTRVMNIYKDPTGVLQHLCAAFHLMSKAHLNDTPHISRCLFKFYKNSESVSFHHLSYSEVYSKIDFNKIPSKITTTLVALEDLGRGSTGKAWLCATVTKPLSAPCVLKFDNEDKRSARLEKERAMWHLLYPEFIGMVKVEVWSGAEALVMPHFSTILVSEHEQYKNEMLTVLNTHFMQNGKVHGDVQWRNIGKYRTKSGEVALVIFDLYDVVDYLEDVHHDWIEKCMHFLFVNA